jgi:RNA polymerase sigma-70 factor (ECF subfamily)
VTLLTTDRTLLMGYREGRPEALERVYREYARPLAGYLRQGFSFQSKGSEHYFNGIQTAYDLDNALQEIFMRAFSPAARERYDGLRPFSGYLFAIARNWVIDHGRRTRREGVLPILPNTEPSHAETDASSAHPSVASEASELGGLIAGFFVDRPEADKTLYTLRFNEELSQMQVAERMGLTRIQVRRREATLLRDLLGHLKRHGYLANAKAPSSSLVRAMSASSTAMLLLSAAVWRLE